MTSKTGGLALARAGALLGAAVLLGLLPGCNDDCEDAADFMQQCIDDGAITAQDPDYAFIQERVSVLGDGCDRDGPADPSCMRCCEADCINELSCSELTGSSIGGARGCLSSSNNCN